MQERKRITSLKFLEICNRIQKIIITFFEDENIFCSFDENVDRRKIRLDKRRIMLYLSNGNMIGYTINNKNLAHLLGINTNYLLSTGMYNEDNSYDVLKKFVSLPNLSYKKYTDGLIDLNNVISPYIDEKLDAFESNAFININDCQFICKYDKNKAYGLYDEDSKMDYIAVQENDGKYYKCILSKDERDNYVLVSNQVYYSYDELVNKLFPIIANQEITMINGMIVKQDYFDAKKIWLNMETRNEKLKLLSKYSKEFECIPNVLRDYLYSQKIISDNKVDNNINNALLLKITSLMEDKQVININKLGFSIEDISPEMHSFINVYNNSLFENNGFDEGKLFSEVQEENVALKKALNEAQEKIDELNSRYNEIEEQYKDKEAELEKLSKKIEEIRKVLG